MVILDSNGTRECQTSHLPSKVGITRRSGPDGHDDALIPCQSRRASVGGLDDQMNRLSRLRVVWNDHRDIERAGIRNLDVSRIAAGVVVLPPAYGDRILVRIRCGRV